MVEFLNPETVHTPLGAYTHTVSVPAATDMLFIAGQVGMRRDGSIPATLPEQAELVYENLRACLAAHGLGMGSVVKLTAFLVAGQDIQAMREIRQRFFGDHRPASTAVYVSALVSPELLLEVEAVAVRAAGPTRHDSIAV